MNQTAELVLPQLTYWGALGRILCAMIVGIIVGAERGRSHRPAGMRTHMLVALGACVVMVTSHMLFVEFRPFGASPDPARLGAQVISGVGFLGAGTILREGLSIKGLTTAASIWTVACLGLAAGAGYYQIALTGAGAVYLTLTVFEVIQRKMNFVRRSNLFLSLDCTDLTGVIHDINRFAVQQTASINHTQFEERDDGSYRVTMNIAFNGVHVDNDQALFLEKLGENSNLRRLEANPY